MDAGVWIGVYLPMFLIFFILIPNNKKKILLRKIMKKRGDKQMTNELIKSCIGSEVLITTGSLGSSYNKVTIIEVVDNWIKVDKKGKIDIINADFVQGIKIL